MKEITLTFNGTATKLISDDKGMFSITELHKASGKANATKPAYWLSNADTQAMLSNLEVGIPTTTKRGRGAGTWGVEQAVYAYASWISPE